MSALALLAGGCLHDKDKAPDSVTLVLFDASQSTGDQQTRKRYLDGFGLVKDFLAKKGGVIGVDVIDANPLAHSNPQTAVVPTKGFNDNPGRYAHDVKAALKPITERASQIVGGGRSRAGTGILDSFRLGERLFAAYDNVQTRYLVLFSDMVEESNRLKFTTRSLQPDAIRAFIDAERKARRLPDLTGVTVYVAGAGPTTGNETSPEKIRAIEDFWRAYVDATGADLSLARYGAELLRFP